MQLPGRARPLEPMMRQPPRFLIGILALFAAAGPAAEQIFLPALPSLQADFGISIAVAQLTVSLSLLAMGVAPLACGPWSDRIGRRPVALGSLALLIGGSAICLIAPNITVLIVGRIVQALGGASGFVLATAIIRDVHGSEDTAANISKVIMPTVLAPMLAAVIGGVLTDHFGWRSTFLVTGVYSVIALVIVMGLLPETRARDVTRDTGVSWRSVLRMPMFHVYAFQYAFSVGIFFAFVASAPYVVVFALRQPATVYGIGFVAVSLGYCLGNAFSVRYSKAVGLDRMVFWGTAISLAAILTMAALMFSGIWTVWAIFVPATVSAAANGVALPNANAGIVNANPDAAGLASGIAGSLQLFVGAAVAQAVGSVLGATPYPMAIGMGAMSLLALVAIAVGAILKPAMAMR
jgi:DHA1 family bicyclomycin/chloramphenicol resistance-like MFS transporter